MRKLLLLSFLTIFLVHSATANSTLSDDSDHFVEWSIAQEATTDVHLSALLNAKIRAGYHLYALKDKSNFPAATSIKIISPLKLNDVKIFQARPKEMKNLDLGTSSFVFEGTTSFPLQFDLAPTAAKATSIDFDIKYSVCTNRVCFPPVHKMLTLKVNLETQGISGSVQKTFSEVKGAAVFEQSSAAGIGSRLAPASTSSGPAPKNFSLGFLLVAFAFGLASVITPCIFPMLPITVSFFLRQKDISQKRRLLQLLLFGAGIVFFFCGLGLAVTLLKGPFALLQIAANTWVNIGIGILLVAMALSLIGVWELRVPSVLLRYLPQSQNQMHTGGILLMGLTLAITSFACIGPFMGTLLASTLTAENLWQPTLSMAAYSIGLAVPFMVLGLFPSLLTRLPRSGNWLLKVKGAFGILVFVLSAKYFMNAYSTWSVVHGRALVAAQAECLPNLHVNNHAAALRTAQKSGQTVLLSFNGYACTNCHWMKDNVFSKADVQAIVDNFVLSELFTDADDVSSQQNQKLEQSRFGTVAIPFYALVNANDEVIATFSGLTRDRDEFINFLRKGENLAIAAKLPKIERNSQCLNN